MLKSRSKCLPQSSELNAHHGEKNYLLKIKNNQKSNNLIPVETLDPTGYLHQRQQLSETSVTSKIFLPTEINSVAQIHHRRHEYESTNYSDQIVQNILNQKNLSEQKLQNYWNTDTNFSTSMEMSSWKIEPQTFSALNQYSIGEQLNTPIKNIEAEFNFSAIANTRQYNQIPTTKANLQSMSKLIVNSNKFNDKNKIFSPESNKQQEETQLLITHQLSPDPWENNGFSFDPFKDKKYIQNQSKSINNSSSVDSSINSPMTPFSNFSAPFEDPRESLFNFDTSFDGNIMLSQDESTVCLANAYLHVRSPSDHAYSLPNDFDSDPKIFAHASFSTNDASNDFSMTDNHVLYKDVMISDCSNIINLFDEDTNLETIKNYSDLIIKKEFSVIPSSEAPVETTVFEQKQALVRCEDKSNCLILNEKINEFHNKSHFEEKFNKSESTEDLIKEEELYIDEDNEINEVEQSDDMFVLTQSTVDLNAISNTEQTIYNKFNNIYSKIVNNINNCNLKNKNKYCSDSISVMEHKPVNTLASEKSNVNQKREPIRKVSPLRINLSKAKSAQNAVIQNKSNLPNTPEILNDALDLEEGRSFNLINYILENNKEIVAVASPAQLSPPQSPISPEPPMLSRKEKRRRLSSESLDFDASPIARSTPKRCRQSVSFYESPSSVLSTSSTINSDEQLLTPSATTKRRGRPPKTQSSILSPSLKKTLSESDWKYMEMRNKNNEASRRSRINRKEKETKLEIEAHELRKEHEILLQREAELNKKCALWKKKVMSLAIL